jgi:hypothetical protein
VGIPGSARARGPGGAAGFVLLRNVDALRTSATISGLLLIPLTLAQVAVSTATGLRISSTGHPRTSMAAGLSIVAAAFLVLAAGRSKARSCRSHDHGFDSDNHRPSREFFVSRRQQSTMAAKARFNFGDVRWRGGRRDPGQTLRLRGACLRGGNDVGVSRSSAGREAMGFAESNGQSGLGSLVEMRNVPMRRGDRHAATNFGCTDRRI